MKRIGLILIALMLVFGVVACSSSNNGGGNTSTPKKTPSADADDKKEKVELSMWMFTGTGLEPYVEQYQQDNPHVTVNIQQQEYGDHHNSLVTALAAGSGAPDIALVEIGYIDGFKADPSKFYNLADFGANDIMGDYLEWKRVQASSSDGQHIYGIPTDVGPMAMMYRTDIFAEAGLPTDAAAVSDLIPTWDKFIEVGKTIKAKTGKPMLYGADAAYSVIRGQALQQYFDEDGNLIADSNPAIKRAWDYSVKMAQEGLTAKIAAWSPEWGAGMNNGDFATMMAPAWMMGFMKGNAPDSAGLWDVAQMPEGSGNWGGSFLTIPSESKHAEEAYKLITWLLTPENQLAQFLSNGNFPSTPSVYDNEAITGFTDEFFSNAPVGKIFSEAARNVVPVYYGPDHITVDTPIQQALSNVERNNENPDTAWNSAIDQIKRDLRR
jgi:cellobiose transport system substrate-binding protein